MSHFIGKRLVGRHGHPFSSLWNPVQLDHNGWNVLAVTVLYSDGKCSPCRCTFCERPRRARLGVVFTVEKRIRYNPLKSLASSRRYATGCRFQRRH